MTLPTSGATARRMFGLVEPIGLIPYATDEPAEVVHAIFYNFALGEVARHIPRVWGLITPDAALAARQQGCVIAQRRILGDLAEAPGLVRAENLCHLGGCTAGRRWLSLALGAGGHVSGGPVR